LDAPRVFEDASHDAVGQFERSPASERSLLSAAHVRL